VHLTDSARRRIARAIRPGGYRHLLPAGIAVFAVLGTLAGVLVAVTGGGSSDSARPTASGGGINASSGSPLFSMPKVRPTTGNAPVVPGFLPNARVAGAIVPAARLTAAHTSVAPLRRTLQADLMIVAPSSLSHQVVASVSRLPGVIAAEQIEAVRMRINGTYTATLGVDPSVFRSFAARPTGASDALWEGVASGGIAVSYTMGKLDKLALGAAVRAAGKKTEQLQVVAFGTMGVGGVNAVVSHAVARSLGAPAGNAIVLSVRSGDISAVAAAAGKRVPHGVSVEQLVTVTGKGQAGSGPASSAAVPVSRIDVMLRAALSRRGMPYVWGAEGPTSFDCSGLVQWSFAKAGIVMPRVAADQALTGPAVPVSQLRPGDLLFYHTDRTAPTYISHVAIYLGNGWMIQAPEPGENVEVVPAAFGSEFAGAVRVNPVQAAAVAARVA
jgi:cell wall-associated NlpC family hydrolase